MFYQIQLIKHATIAEPGQRFVNQIDLLPFETLVKKLTFPEDLIFVHKNLFCGSAKTRSTATMACQLSWEQNRSFFQKYQLNSLEYFALGFSLTTLGLMYYKMR